MTTSIRFLAFTEYELVNLGKRNILSPEIIRICTSALLKGIAKIMDIPQVIKVWLSFGWIIFGHRSYRQGRFHAPSGSSLRYSIQKNIFCGAFFLGDTVPKQWMVLMLEFMHKKLTLMTVRSFLGHNLTVKDFVSGTVRPWRNW